MAKFLYQAKNNAGKLSVGQVDALDENDAKARLKTKNLTVLKLVRAGESGGGGGLNLFDGGRVGSRDLQIFTRQFATLINAGIPIVDSLRILSEGKRNPILKETAAKVKDAIETGKRLSDAMMVHPKVFDRLFVNMIRAGEEAGILDTILNRLSIYMEKSEKLRKQIKSAMTYPVTVISIAIVVVWGLLVFIVPKFQAMYKGFGKDLPALTQIVINISDFMQEKWYLIVGIGIGLPMFLVSYYRSPDGKDAFDRILIRSPMFGDLIQKSAVAKMSRTLSTLLSSGVGVVDALEIAARTAGNKVVEDALLRSKESVVSGKPLAQPLAREKMIPDMVVQMIAIGEQSGTLDTMLGKIADFYEDDVENAVKALTSMIEPLMMVGLGSVIAFLVAAMYLPIFSMAGGM